MLKTIFVWNKTIFFLIYCKPNWYELCSNIESATFVFYIPLKRINLMWILQEYKLQDNNRGKLWNEEFKLQIYTKIVTRTGTFLMQRKQIFTFTAAGVKKKILKDVRGLADTTPEGRITKVKSLSPQVTALPSSALKK